MVGSAAEVGACVGQAGFVVGLVAQHSAQVALGPWFAQAGLVAAPCSAQAGCAVAVALAVAQFFGQGFGLCVAQDALVAPAALLVAPCAVTLAVPAGLALVVPAVTLAVPSAAAAAAAAAACVAAWYCTQGLMVAAAAAARLAQLPVVGLAAHAVDPPPCHSAPSVVAGCPLHVADVPLLGVLPWFLCHPVLGVLVLAALAAAGLVGKGSVVLAGLLAAAVVDILLVASWLWSAVAVLVAPDPVLLVLLLLLLAEPSSGCLACWFAF